MSNELLSIHVADGMSISVGRWVLRCLNLTSSFLACLCTTSNTLPDLKWNSHVGTSGQVVQNAHIIKLQGQVRFSFRTADLAVGGQRMK